MNKEIKITIGLFILLFSVSYPFIFYLGFINNVQWAQITITLAIWFLFIKNTIYWIKNQTKKDKKETIDRMKTSTNNFLFYLTIFIAEMVVFYFHENYDLFLINFTNILIALYYLINKSEVKTPATIDNHSIKSLIKKPSLAEKILGSQGLLKFVFNKHIGL